MPQILKGLKGGGLLPRSHFRFVALYWKLVWLLTMRIGRRDNQLSGPVIRRYTACGIDHGQPEILSFEITE